MQASKFNATSDVFYVRVLHSTRSNALMKPSKKMSRLTYQIAD